MKKLAILNFFTVWFILAAALFLLPAPARAYVYDDFTGPGINENLWVDRGPNYGLFSQPGDGNLYFSDPTGGQTDSLRSALAWNVPFFVSLRYADLQAVNHSVGEEFSGSSVNLWVGYGNNSVAVYEFYKDDYGTGHGYAFRAAETVNGITTALTKPIPTTVNSGWLGINFDGAQVTVMYAPEGSGWQEIATITAPPFASSPYFGVKGYDPYGLSLSFRVEQVDFNPVPLPPGVWLLGSGLLGLAGLGRRLKRN